MSFTVGRLLVHDEQVPAAARDALRAAYEAEPSLRDAMLASAARILHAEANIECRDALEIVDLPGAECRD